MTDLTQLKIIRERLLHLYQFPYAMATKQDLVYLMTEAVDLLKVYDDTVQDLAEELLETLQDYTEQAKKRIDPDDLDNIQN